MRKNPLKILSLPVMIVALSCVPPEPAEIIDVKWCPNTGGIESVSALNEGDTVYFMVKAENAEGMRSTIEIRTRDDVLAESYTETIENQFGVVRWISEVAGPGSYSYNRGRVKLPGSDVWVVSEELYVDKLFYLYWSGDSLGQDTLYLYSDTLHEGDTVYAIAGTRNADGDSLYFQVWEYDAFSKDELYAKGYRVVQNDRAVLDWRIKNVGDWPWSNYSKFYVKCRWEPEGIWIEAPDMIYAEEE